MTDLTKATVDGGARSSNEPVEISQQTIAALRRVVAHLEKEWRDYFRAEIVDDLTFGNILPRGALQMDNRSVDDAADAVSPGGYYYPIAAKSICPRGHLYLSIRVLRRFLDAQKAKVKRPAPPSTEVVA